MSCSVVFRLDGISVHLYSIHYTHTVYSYSLQHMRRSRTSTRTTQVSRSETRAYFRVVQKRRPNTSTLSPIRSLRKRSLKRGHPTVRPVTPPSCLYRQCRRRLWRLRQRSPQSGESRWFLEQQEEWRRRRQEDRVVPQKVVWRRDPLESCHRCRFQRHRFRHTPGPLGCSEVRERRHVVTIWRWTRCTPRHAKTPTTK